MITFMRRYRRGLQAGLLVVIVAFVASLFIFGSSGFDSSGPSSDSVATVNGENISRKQYRDRYQLYVEYFSQGQRGRLTPELAEQLGLPQRVVDELVNEAVVAQRAEAEGLAMSDEEFNAAVHAIPSFQEGGKFSMARYQSFLKARGTGAERDLRRSLTMNKVRRIIADGVRVTDAEVDQAWGLRREEVRAAWALVELGPLMAAAAAGEEEVAEYYKTHGDDFKQPERRKVQYVTLVAKDFAGKVSDADVEKYYTEHLKDYETPAQVQARHVLARVSDTGGSEAEDRAREKIADVIKRARAGEDFAKLAKEISEDPGSKDKGGELGWVSKGDMVPQFEQALFALKKGEITTEPVRSPFGFHAIKVTDVRAASRKAMKDVAGEIRDKIGADVADKAARARADEVRPALQKAQDFSAEAKKLGLAPIDTTMTKTQRPPTPGASGETLEEAAFALALGGVTTPVRTPTGWVVLKVVEAIPAGVPPLADIKDRVTAVVKHRKADTTASARAKQLAEDAAGGNLEAAAKKAGATYGDTPKFSRAKPAEKLPGDVQLAALQTPVGQSSPPVRTPSGYYVVKVLERAPAGPVEQAERQKLVQELTGQKQNHVWERWVLGARSESKIEVVNQRAERRS